LQRSQSVILKRGKEMPTTKVAITLDEGVVREIDRWVKEGKYPNRSKAIQEAIKERMGHLRKTRLVREASRLNPEEEKALAEEGLGVENKEGLFELLE
jgi:Arc/MetJ-type ribon-helix-helix transcriptional regulator